MLSGIFAQSPPPKEQTDNTTSKPSTPTSTSPVATSSMAPPEAPDSTAEIPTATSGNSKNKTLPLRPISPQSPERKRPGTSGTELNLRTMKKDASSAYLTAQKAEREYRTKRQAKAAREEGRAAKMHLGVACREGKMGTNALFRAIKLTPAFLREKMGGKKEGKVAKSEKKKEKEKEKEKKEKKKEKKEKKPTKNEKKALKELAKDDEVIE